MAMLSALLNWLKMQFVFSFLFFYTTIYDLTLGKVVPLVVWLEAMQESLIIMGGSILYLIYGIFYYYYHGWLVFGNVRKSHIFKKCIAFKDLLITWSFDFFYTRHFFRTLISELFAFKKLVKKEEINIKRKERDPRLDFINLIEQWVFYKEIILVFYSFFKSTISAITLASTLAMYLIFFYQISLVKQLAIWFIVGMMYFWLFSGFNFFIKRYAFGNFTSAVKRFWKRANSCFWLIEGFLFLLFYYYYLNSSQEPLYLYDYSSLNQEYLHFLPTAYISLFSLTFLFLLLTFFVIKVNNLTFFQNIYFILVTTVIIFFVFFIESYQFYYVLNSFFEKTWAFDDELLEWKALLEAPKWRTKMLYFSMCLIAKFWHFMFIFFVWIFFIMKVFETKQVSFDLLALNVQNILILYLLNILSYSQWIKWSLRRYVDIIYFWFFTAYESKITFFFLKWSLYVYEKFNNKIILFNKKLWTFFYIIFYSTILYYWFIYYG